MLFIFLLTIIFNISANILAIESEYGLYEIPKTKLIENLEEIFIHRESWRNIADFQYATPWDGGTNNFINPYPFSPEKVPAGSIIFTNAFVLDKFWKEIHPKIKYPYVLISLFCGAIEPYIYDPKIIAWLGNANNLAFPKFINIPLGVFRDESIYQNRKQAFQAFNRLKNKPKTKLLYMNFCIQNNTQEREPVYKLFKDKAYCTCTIKNYQIQRKPFFEFLEEMADFKFVLSPWGDMLDCYRHWEALLVGSIPIIRSCSLDDLFSDLPVLVIKDWNEITEEFLNKKYEEIMSKKDYNFEKLYMKYWVEKINQERNKFFKK